MKLHNFSISLKTICEGLCHKLFFQVVAVHHLNYHHHHHDINNQTPRKKDKKKKQCKNYCDNTKKVVTGWYFFFFYKATPVKAAIKNKLSTVKYTDYIPSRFRIGGGAGEDVYN